MLTLPERSFSYDVYAFYGDLKIGKIRVVSLEQKERKVRIVPLVAISQSESAIEQAVNSIFAPANVVLDVEIDSLYASSSFNTQTVFESPNTTLLEKYTEQMRALRDEYIQNHLFESGTQLIFVIPSFQDPSIDGYMVRGRALGFITQNSLADLSTLSHTLAHELGHGIGGLVHSWGENQNLKGITNNLLDYSTSNGSKLIKSQWENLNSPSFIFSLLDDEEDAMYTIKSLNYKCIPDDISFYQNEIFMDLDGNPFQMSSNFAPYLFVGYSSDNNLNGAVAVVVNKQNGNLYYPIKKQNAKGYHCYGLGTIIDSYIPNLYTGNTLPTKLMSFDENYTLERNGQVIKNTDFYYGEDCPGIPKKKGKTDGSTSTVCTSSDQIKQITKFNQQINNQDFFEASEELCKILKNESDCALENLSFENRFKVLARLVSEDGGWVFEIPQNKGVNILGRVVWNTPGTQEVQLLEAFRNNNWFEKMENQFGETFDYDTPDIQAFSEVVDYLAYLAKKRDQLLNKLPCETTTFNRISPNLSINNNSNSNTTPLNTLLNSYINNPLQNQNIYLNTIPTGKVYEDIVSNKNFTIVIGGAEGEEFKVGETNSKAVIDNMFQHKYVIGNSSEDGYLIKVKDNKIVFFPDYKLYLSQYGVVISQQGQGIEDRLIYDLENKSYELDPYEFVEIIFAKQYPEIGATKGERRVVPAILAYDIYLRSREVESERTWTSVFNKIAIGAGTIALFTNPLTLVGSLAILEGVVASIDQTIESKRLDGEMTSAEYNSLYYQNWKKTKTWIDAVLVATAPETMMQGFGANWRYLLRSTNYERSFTNKLSNYTNTSNLVYGEFEEAYLFEECLRKGVKVGDALEDVSGVVGAIQTATKSITKSRLPNEFVNALKAFGKSEDDILEYFTNYHNIRSGQKFLNDIENFIMNSNQYNLTRGEAFALWGYTTNYFYRDLNAWLRNGINISQTSEIKLLLNSALNKLPNYGGVKVYRGIEINPSQIDDFIVSYANGNSKIWNDFTSCGGSVQASFGGRPEINVIFEIQHSTAKEITSLADGVKYGVPPMPAPEILIKAGCNFTVIAPPVFDNLLQKWIIKLIQTQ